MAIVATEDEGSDSRTGEDGEKMRGDAAAAASAHCPHRMAKKLAAGLNTDA